MRFKGINYDTGSLHCPTRLAKSHHVEFLPAPQEVIFSSAGTTAREPFDAEVVRREMEIIHNDLQCDAVRITGGYPAAGDCVGPRCRSGS